MISEVACNQFVANSETGIVCPLAALFFNPFLFEFVGAFQAVASAGRLWSNVAHRAKVRLRRFSRSALGGSALRDALAPEAVGMVCAVRFCFTP